MKRIAQKICYGNLILIILLVLVSCATAPPTGYQFQAGDVRIVQTQIYTDGSYSDETIMEAIENTNIYLMERVGVRLEIIDIKPIYFLSTSRQGLIDTIYCYAYQNIQDIAVALTSKTGFDVIKEFLPFFNLIPNKETKLLHAVVDDTWRRYIVSKSLEPWVIAHEVLHTFIFSHPHSGGIMGSRFWSIPFTTVGWGSFALHEKDREEILKNKWRNFNEKVDLLKREDVISENLDCRSLMRGER